MLLINQFKANFPFLYFLKTLDNVRFPGGIEMEQWPKMR